MEMLTTTIITVPITLLCLMFGCCMGLFIYQQVNGKKIEPETKRQIDWERLMQKHPRFYKFFHGENSLNSAPETVPCANKEINIDTEKQEDNKTVSAGEFYATLMAENYRKAIQKRLRQKQFLKRHPETEQMIHSLKCINGSIQGINNAVRKLSDNLRDLQKKITELSELAE